MMKIQYFLALYDEEEGWSIGDEPFFPASKAFIAAKQYQGMGLKCEVVEQMQRTVARFEPEPLKAA